MFILLIITWHHLCFNMDPNWVGWRKQWHPTPVLLPGKFHGWRSLVGCSPRGRRSRTRLSNFTFTFHFPALEKEMAPHSSVLAWRIPGTGELDRLPSMGLHRVGHDWSDLAAAAANWVRNNQISNYPNAGINAFISFINYPPFFFCFVLFIATL